MIAVLLCRWFGHRLRVLTFMGHPGALYCDRCWRYAIYPAPPRDGQAVQL